MRDLAEIIETPRPAAHGLVTRAEQPIPFADARDEQDPGSRPATPVAGGVRRALAEGARPQKEGRLDTRELA